MTGRHMSRVGIIALSALTTGCAFNRNLPISQTYTISPLQTLSPNKLVYRARVDQGFTIEPYKTIVIREVDTHNVTSQHRELAERVGKEFRTVLRHRLEGIFPAKQIVLQPGLNDAVPILQLRCAFTEFSPGNGFVRWFFGMGWGAVKVQVEGQGEEEGHDHPRFEFVRKKMNDGYPLGGINFMVFDNELTLKDSLDDLAKDVASFIASL